MENHSIFDACLERAIECSNDESCDQICHYPMFWFEIARGKSWEQIRNEAGNSYIRSLSLRENRKFDMAVLDTQILAKSEDAAQRKEGAEKYQALWRRMFEYHSRELYCRRRGVDPKTHNWNSLEIAVTTPDDAEAIEKADSQERISDEIFDVIDYLDPGREPMNLNLQ